MIPNATPSNDELIPPLQEDQIEVMRAAQTACVKLFPVIAESEATRVNRMTYLKKAAEAHGISWDSYVKYEMGRLKK